MNIYEHYETAFEQDIDLKEIYLDQVWKILQDSYTDIGGLRTFKTPNDLLKLTICGRWLQEMVK